MKFKFIILLDYIYNRKYNRHLVAPYWYLDVWSGKEDFLEEDEDDVRHDVTLVDLVQQDMGELEQAAVGLEPLEQDTGRTVQDGALNSIQSISSAKVDNFFT